MAENETVGAADDQKETVTAPTGAPAKSPWKTPVVVDAPVIGATDSWPALNDAQQHPRPLRTVDSPPDPPIVQVYFVS